MVNTNLVSIKINNIPLQVPEGTRILDACRDNGFHVPYLCYLKDINEIGACRVCVVEVKGIHHLVTFQQQPGSGRHGDSHKLPQSP